MAADGSVYSGELFMGSVPYALRLLEYDSDMKLHFYLDALLCTGDDPATATFIGLIINNPSSVNYKYHSTSRHFNVKVNIGGVEYVVLNDAGLNTLGTCSVGSLSASIAAGLIVPITYRTAYYVDTDGINIKYKKNGDTVWTSYSAKGSTPKKEYGTFNKGLTSLTSSLAPNDLVYVKVEHVNAEGTFTSEQVSLTLPYPSLVMAYGGYASTAFTNFGNNTDKGIRYFSAYEIVVGTAIYDNSTGYITLPAGYYACASFWIKVEMNADPEPKSVVTKIGDIDTWDTGDPSTPTGYGTHNFIHFDSPASHWATACALLSGYAGDPVTLYQSTTNSLFYTNTGLTTLATDGNYYTDSSNFIVLQAGQNVGSGDCVNGPIIT